MKYKLKKIYPNGPKLGTIINRRVIGEDYWSYDNSRVVLFAKDHPENYPEIWEKVVEKDYEILSVITNNNKFIEKVYNQDATIEPYWKIHSVKRLFDGEIFTIGDKIDFVINSNLRKDTIHKIKSIELNPNGIVFRAENSSWSNYLNEISKIKKPLFTTEDGLDIFEGDNIYWVNINTFEKVNCNKYNDDLGEISIKSLLSKKYECKAVGFSTKVKAEEYILMNKPCLSYNEVLNATKIRNKNTFETLKELVKSKIQQSV